jgi:lipid-binding SYLF domain-containing protein
MRRLLPSVLAVFLLIVAAGCQTAPPRDVQAQALVDRSKITLEFFKTRTKDSTALFLSSLENAKGVMIFPSVFQAGAGIGGAGGSGIMLVRDAKGEWSYPAFYEFYGGSLGLQLGAQSTELVLLMMTDRAVDAVISSPGQIGFDTQATFGQLSAGDLSSTTAQGGSIVGFTKGEGLYAGASLSGASVSPKSDWTEPYYGRFYTAQEVLLEGKAQNRGADPLREALTVRN